VRAALVLGILGLLALCAIGLVFWGAPRAARDTGEIVAPSSDDTPAVVADPGSGAARRTVEPAPAAPIAGARASGEPIERKDEDAFWRRCLGLPPDEVRDCIRAGLGAAVPAPAELAGMLCAGGPPDGADLQLAVEVIRRWDAATVPEGVQELGELCPGSADVALALVRDLFPSDPAWCARLAAAIRPELAFSEGAGGRSLLALADALAEVGFDDQRLLLEGGARGDFGGGDEQVAFALVNAWALQREERGRIEFLESVVRAPNFRGRPQELRTLVDCAIDAAMVTDDVGAALRLVDEILASPVHARGAAETLLERHRLSRLPRWLTTGDGGALLARAKELASVPAPDVPR
jgi:hypothetical protein